MLKKINRITRRRDFEEVRGKGLMVQSFLFGFNYLLVGEEKKFGFIVSKKISKRAVDRNKIRRLLAEGVKKNMGEVKGGIFGIFLAKKALLGKKFEEVEKEVKEVFKKI